VLESKPLGWSEAADPMGVDRVLVVADPEGSQAKALVRLLAAQGCAASVHDEDAALDAAADRPHLLALVWSHRAATDSVRLMDRLQQRAPAMRIALLGAGGGDGAAAAVRARAFDYLEEPVSPAALEATIRRARTEPDPRQAALLLSLQALAPGLVHELRNPLSGVLAGSQMIRRMLQAQDKVTEYAEIVEEGARTLERFLSRLAEFGRLRMQPAQPMDRLDAAALLARVVERTEPDCRARGIRIVTAFDPKASSLRGDPRRLELAWTELLKNAQEAMPEGGTLTVRTRVRSAEQPRISGSGPSMQPGDPLTEEAAAEGEWFEGTCCDTGRGLTAEARQRAFEPFFSTRPGALGVGLPLAQAIVWGHGGMLRLDAARAGGVCALLSLPVGSSESI
jgi:signal transduction histidine kinase